MSAVFKTKFCPLFIGPLKVIAKKGLVYTRYLLRKLRTHPLFYVVLLKLYHYPSIVDLGGRGIVPRRRKLPQKDESSSRALPNQPTNRAGCIPPSEVICRPSLSSRSGSFSHETDPTHSMTGHERVALDRRPPAVVSSQSQTDPMHYACERETRRGK